jgi:hypothetical protein
LIKLADIPLLQDTLARYVDKHVTLSPMAPSLKLLIEGGTGVRLAVNALFQVVKARETVTSFSATEVEAVGARRLRDVSPLSVVMPELEAWADDWDVSRQEGLTQEQAKRYKACLRTQNKLVSLSPCLVFPPFF